jgi:hypothetical protein
MINYGIHGTNGYEDEEINPLDRVLNKWMMGDKLKRKEVDLIARHLYNQRSFMREHFAQVELKRVFNAPAR